MRKNIFYLILLLLFLAFLVGIYAVFTEDSGGESDKKSKAESFLVARALSGEFSIQCSYRSFIDDEKYRTFVYIKNGQIASETPVGQNTSVHFVMQGDHVGYSWKDGVRNGYRFKVALNQSDRKSLSALVQNFAEKTDTQITESRCIKSDVSSVRFTIPKNVDFEKFVPDQEKD